VSYVRFIATLVVSLMVMFILSLEQSGRSIIST